MEGDQAEAGQAAGNEGSQTAEGTQADEGNQEADNQQEGNNGEENAQADAAQGEVVEGNAGRAEGEEVKQEENTKGDVKGEVIKEEGQQDQKRDTVKETNRPEGSIGASAFEDHYYEAMKPNYQWINWSEQDILIALSTDKPVYRPGDTLYASAYFFNHTTKAPINCQSYTPTLSLINSKQENVFEFTPSDQSGCSGTSMLYKIQLPEDIKGGMYILNLNYYSLPQSRILIRIRDYQQTVLVSLDYDKESYNPGDQVQGKLNVIDKQIDPGFENSSFDVSTSAGDKVENIDIGEDGTGTFSFTIPQDWKEDSIFVTFTVRLGASESVKTDVVTVNQKETVIIDFTGESGRIIYGISNKVYFEVFSDESRSDHLDISGAELIEEGSSGSSNVLADKVSTIFFGRGLFRFTPQQGNKYYLRWQETIYPMDIDEYNKYFEIGAFKSDTKVILSVRNPVVESGEDLDIRIINSNPTNTVVLVLTLSQKENILYSRRILLENEKTDVKVSGEDFDLMNGGVFSVDLYEPGYITQNQDITNDQRVYQEESSFSYQMVANNLCFMLPKDKLDIQIITDKDKYEPGDTVNYEVRVLDHLTQQPPKDEVIIGLSATDLTPFLELDKNRQPANLVSKVYLEKEIKPTEQYEFLNANQYLDFFYLPEDCQCDSIQESKLKLELLMGTQKWRLYMFDPNFQQYRENQVSEEDTFEYYIYQNLLLKGTEYILYKEAMQDGAVAQEAAGGAEATNAGGQVEKNTQQDDSTGEGAQEEGAQEEASQEQESGGDTTEETKNNQAERTDFTQTQLFTDYIFTAQGRYKGSFKLSDLISTFRFEVNAITYDGVYGVHRKTFTTEKDFFIDSKIPLFLTSQDSLDVPIIINNRRSESVTVELTATSNLNYDALTLELSESSVTVDPSSTKQVVLKMKANQQTFEDFKVTLSANCGENCSDSFSTDTRIIGRGFPVIKSDSGFIGAGEISFVSDASLSVALPESYEEGTLQVRAKVYTSQLDHIYEALAALIREPHGCFEQTSATTYPLVMALIFLESLPDKNDQINKMIAEGKTNLKKGYDKLISYECSEGGYEWFGSCPGNEALTAYGLLQFNEMKEVLSDVDDSMITRTKEWLIGRKDGKGSFKVAQNGLDEFANPPADIADAYILWVLTSIGGGAGLETEIDAVVEKEKTSDDNYFRALVALILYNVDRVEEASALSKILEASQDKKTGEVLRKVTSITRSYGISLNIETTSLSALAWMKDPSKQFAKATDLAVGYIISNIQNGMFGSTQATILALKVLIEVLRNSNFEGQGTFELTIDGEVVSTKSFNDETDSSAMGK